jgi:MFS family permease
LHLAMPIVLARQQRAVFSRRWLQVAAAAMFINTSYGTLSYAFSVFVTESGPGGEFGAGVVSAGFGAALLVSGVSGIFAGTVDDLLGTRRLMAGGAVLGCGGLALLAAAREPWQFVAVLAVVLGPAMAATFYEPVYVLMNRWFPAEERPRAYGVLTLLSGFSITIFTPLTRWLVDGLGWRAAMVVLGGILLAVGTAVPAVIREPAAPARARLTPQGFLREAAAGVRQANRAFWLFTLAFFVATVAFSGFQFHLVAGLEGRGFAPGGVAWAIAVTGIVSLPARLLLPLLSERISSPALLALCFTGVAGAALTTAVADSWWQVWVVVGLFGTVFGAIYPLRALVISERFAGPYFGRLIGLQALFVATGRAAGPAAIGLAGTSPPGYELGFRVAAAVLVASAAVTWLALGRRPG